jgi:hypothetical protein
MEFQAVIKGGELSFAASVRLAFLRYRETHEGARLVVKEYEGPTRTEAQNRALHLYCEQVADALNSGGLTIEQVLKNFTMELEWSKESVKEILWRTAQKRLLGKTSTTELSKQEDVSKVYEATNRFLAKLGIHIPFPTYEPGYRDTAPLKTDV